MRRKVEICGVLVPALLGLAAASGCDAPAAEMAVEARADVPEPPTMAAYTVAAADFDLEATLALVERKDVESAAELEVILNADDSPIRVDVDRDGARDFIQVHEVAPPARGRATFEFRAVASASAHLEADATFVTLATADFELDPATRVVTIEGRYAPVVVDVRPEVTVVRHFEPSVVVAAPFFTWLWVGGRAEYVGHVHLPPGHAKKVGLAWTVHHGPVHAHVRGHGHAHVRGHGHGHAHGPLVVHVHGHGHAHGPLLVQVRGHGHVHGPGHLHVHGHGHVHGPGHGFHAEVPAVTWGGHPGGHIHGKAKVGGRGHASFGKASVRVKPPAPEFKAKASFKVSGGGAKAGAKAKVGHRKGPGKGRR